MFGRRRPDAEDRKMADAPDDLGIPMKPARPPGQAASVAPVARVPSPVPPRTPGEPAPAPAAPPPARRIEPEARRLIVGREISLSGEINSCDRLVVEGSVEANLQNCRDVDIAESGLFKGSAVIDEAEVRGRFEGELVVRKRLLIRATGRVTGVIRYGQIEVECGGQISGDIQAQPEEGVVTDLQGARAAY